MRFSTALTWRQVNPGDLADHPARYTRAGHSRSIGPQRQCHGADLSRLHANGYGLPQNYIEAANWLRLACEQGFPEAQYLLGLMYNKGQGVPQDYVEAYKWLDLAVAQARGRQRDDWVRIRNAIATKLNLEERTRAQALVMAGRPPSAMSAVGAAGYPRGG
jgi:Sel1 repeat